MEEEFHEKNLQILKYEIQIEFDEDWNYFLFINIHFNVLEVLDSFSFHSSLNLQIENPICKQEDIENEASLGYIQEGFLTFSFNEKLKKGLGKLSFQLKSKPNWKRKDKRGPWVYTTNDKNMIRYTDFEPFLARKAFLCIDNTSSKAHFKLSVKCPIVKTLLSNLPIETIKIEKDFQEVSFEETPKLSPYNFAFICGDLKEIVFSKYKDFKITVYGINNYIKVGNYIIEIATKTIQYMEELTQVVVDKLGIKKLDIALIPNFPDQGMESHGLIYLVSDFDKTFYTDLTIHEVIHQWIGNYVSFPFWIKEGLTTIFEDLIYDKITGQKGQERLLDGWIDFDKMEKSFEESDYDELADWIYQYKKEEELKSILQRLFKEYPFDYVPENVFVDIVKSKN